MNKNSLKCSQQLHVQIAFVMQRSQCDGLVNWELKTFEQIQDDFNRKDIEEVDVDDEAGERKIMQLSKCSDASARARDEVGNLEWWNVTELWADRSDDASFLNVFSFVFAETLKWDDWAILSCFNPWFEKFSDCCKVI